MNKMYIKKFIRDDGATLELDGIELYLAMDNTLLARPNPETTAINYTEANGGEMIRQQNPAFEQPINGLLIPKETPYWELVQKLNTFWQINHTYRLIYMKRDGSMFAINNAWISGGLQIIPTAREEYSEWNITLTIGSEAWREYAEDNQGKEIYASNIILPLLTAGAGGESWDKDGLVMDEIGEVWADGSGGVQSVIINSVTTVYPVWTVIGPCINPSLQNNTTDTSAKYLGTVAAGQTLTVDFEAGTAHLDGALVTRSVVGLVSCAVGENVIGFNSDGGTTNQSKLSWNNVIG